MPDENDGTERTDGYSNAEIEDDEVLLYEGENPPTDDEIDDLMEDAEEPEGEDGDPDETEDDVNWEQRYKDLQRTHSTSQDELKAERDTNSAIEHNLNRFGGAEQAIKALEYVTTDKDFKALAEKKQKGEMIPGLDESKMSPQQKEAFNTVKQMIESVIDPMKRDIDDKLKNVVETNITPHTQAIRDANLESHLDKMTEKYGEEWLGQLDSMENLKDNLSEQQTVAPSLKDIERLYIDSLREDGKFNDFIIKQAKLLAKSKSTKSTKRPKSAGTSVSDGGTKPKGKIDIFEAGRRVLARQKG